MRIVNHPIMGSLKQRKKLSLFVNGKQIEAFEGETIAAAILASGTRLLRRSRKYGEPRGIFCGIGRCSDCIMTVNGMENIRTCITLVEDGMRVIIPEKIKGGQVD